MSSQNDKRFGLKNRWGWLVTFCTFLIITPVTGVLCCFGVFYVKLQEEFGISDFVAGWIGALGFGVMFAFSPVSTWLFKRFGHRIIITVGVLLCAIGLMLSSFVPNAYYLFLTYSILFGIGSNFVDNTTLNLIGAYFPRKNSARATCFATLGWSVGSLALNPALERICQIVGWRHSFQILSGLFLTYGMLTTLAFRPAPERYEDIPETDEEKMGMPLSGDRKRSVMKKPNMSQVVPEEKPEVRRRKVSTTGAEHTPTEYIKTFLKTLKAPGIILWFFGNMWMNLSLIFPFVNMIKYMTTIGIPEANGAFVLSIMGVADMVGRGSGALLGDYLPFHCVYVYPIFNTVMAIATYALLLVNDIDGMFIFASVVGVSTGIVNSMLFKACIDLFGVTILAEAWTLSLLAAGIGTTIGPTVAGLTYDVTGSFNVAFIIGGSMFVMASLSTLFIPCWQKHKRWVPVKAQKMSQVQKMPSIQEYSSPKNQWKPVKLNDNDAITEAEEAELTSLTRSNSSPSSGTSDETDQSTDSRDMNKAEDKPLVVEQFVWVV